MDGMSDRRVTRNKTKSFSIFERRMAPSACQRGYFEWWHHVGDVVLVF